MRIIIHTRMILDHALTDLLYNMSLIDKRYLRKNYRIEANYGQWFSRCEH